MARAVADRLGPLLKQAVVVENRPGASNTLAADVTAKSTDGHTMVMGVSTAHAIAPHLLKLGYDSNKDLVPVVFVGAVPNVLVVNNALPVDSVQSLVKLARSQPGQLNYASSGSGSTQHIAAELFKDSAGVFITHIPYRGSGPALIDLVGGQVQLIFDTMPSVIGQVRNGRIKALAVASAKRNPQLPQRAHHGRSGLARGGNECLVRHLHAVFHAQGRSGSGVRRRCQGAGLARDAIPPGRHWRRPDPDDAGPVRSHSHR